MQTGDRHKTKYFQDNIVLWKTLQDGISEQEGFFPIRAIVRYFCAAYRLERDLFTSGVSFILNCSSHSSFFLFEITFSIFGDDRHPWLKRNLLKKSVRARRGPWLRVKTLSLQGRGRE